MKSRINWQLVASQLAETREEIERLERLAGDPKARSEAALQVGIEHAYHHLNFAWNARRMTLRAYRSITTRQFKRHSRFPPLRPIGV